MNLAHFSSDGNMYTVMNVFFHLNFLLVAVEFNRQYIGTKLSMNLAHFCSDGKMYTVMNFFFTLFELQ